MATVTQPGTSLGAFETRRMVGERIGPQHFDELKRFLQEPVMSSWLGAVDDDQALAYLRGHCDHWDLHGFGIWVFRDRETGHLIGRGGIERTAHGGKGVMRDQATVETEILYAVDPPLWNRGLATEMSEAFVRIAFGTLQLPELIAFTLHRNVASQRVMQKVGFTYERDIEHAGEPHVLYRLHAPALPRL